ncbi:MAG: Cytosine deaminase and related metal-dependent hydrolase [Firmicutes bacterium]|nr:Cytosine deaminase and related metal-dependent hydrolase [Bacillota bacterium]
MNIKFINAKIITMEEPVQVLEGELWVEGDKVSYVGPMKDDKDIKWDRKIDADGNIIMPGFKNAHTHSSMTFLRSFADDLSLQEWLYERTFPMEAKLTGEYIYHFSKLAIMEYLTSGMTANFDMYMQNKFIAKASKECGFRTVLCGSINDFGGTIEEIEEEYTHFNYYDPLISYMIGFHAEYTTKRETLEGIAALGQKYKAPIYTHNSESRNEVDGCIERYGKTPTVFLDSLGLFEYGGGGFHCVHMSEDDLAICKEKKLHVVTNPASNLKLASGIAPISKMLDMDINLGIGTDGAASNNCLDMFREMFLVTGLAKYRDMDASSVDAVNVLKMATIGGAKAMGLKECDTIASGKKADLIMIDMHQPNMQPMNNIIKNIVYAGSKQNVVLTMVEGKILYDLLDGKPKFDVGVEPEEVYVKVNEIMRGM